MSRYIAIFGPNTKQWWVYDNEKDCYIDPPKNLLKYIKNAGDIDKQEKRLSDVLRRRPKWLKNVLPQRSDFGFDI